MGDDYSTLQVYTGQTSLKTARQRLIHTIVAIMESQNFFQVPTKDQIHNRVIAVGPAEERPWFAVYDSISFPDEESEFELLHSFSDFKFLAQALSNQFGPAVTIEMDDSCALKLELYIGGKRADVYADSPTIGTIIQKGTWTEAQHRLFGGHPEIWAKYLNLSIEKQNDLRRAWPIGKGDVYIGSTQILSDTAEILGWNRYFCMTGYNIGAEGIPFSYRVPFPYWDLDPNDFDELYFLQNEVDWY